MSILARASLRAARVAVPRQQIRSMHVDNVVDHALPTNVTNKPWLAAKIIIYGCTGFGLPFYAAHWHMQKAGAA
ncbi:uncharacterized protein MKK02DRAFT_37554 [Dioszegia hungarica]|uniref:Cytochrome c oxidase subunit 8, mitochondrial n=1 Tax=Dioszegia hungarica TaxID=4972 RepID=A0AA38LRQ5_9TREE|nr:uncharacterized protein MKK02DRAFT_37554 [Dioszegia hungarica]KAI9634677.1 hypothetical protein MKK02DRAFT_37554 [Dioszegia hungarica]